MRYKECAPWTQGDADNLQRFLKTETGVKFEQMTVNRVLDTAQQAMTEKGSPFAVGAAFGRRQAWVELRTLSAHGAAPEEGSENA